MNSAASACDPQWIDICHLEDLTPNRGVAALLGDQQVAIFYLAKDEAVYAIHNYDPIGKANVLARGIVGDVKGEVVVASPLYKQHFSLISGQCVEDENVRVPVYKVRIVEGRIQVCSESG